VCPGRGGFVCDILCGKDVAEEDFLNIFRLDTSTLDGSLRR